MMASQPWLRLLVIFRSGPLVIRPLRAHQGGMASKMQQDTIKNYKKKSKEISDSPSHESTDPVLYPPRSPMNQHQICIVYLLPECKCMTAS
ncbi:hypothetical protein ACQKWADRAFT_291894 [Trichoderma austrokoningii]